MPPTSPEQAAALHRATANEAEKLVWRASDAPAAGTTTTAVIGERAPLSWPHPFTLDRFDLHDATAFEARASTPEVLFVQSGALTVAWADGTVVLTEGDTMTVPVGLNRALSGTCVAYRVSG